ncbi:MAG: hydroxymethylglutaryl-CoA lyase [Cyclobacteriaceae bacterium]|nr:hydroxymethylglutaryl-CoA lyase [Cyclobacteriaceae bacterium HetDA_MAG_MS6]
MKVIECPRDAMQGIKSFVPTIEKIDYLNRILKVGFDTIDFGSFVSPKAIPQMKDTEAVLKGLDLSETNSKLLTIIANERGAQEACGLEEIAYLGFPLSLSETFQQKNTNKTIDEALVAVAHIQDLALQHNKVLVVYLSMGFGNPYGEAYSAEIVVDFIQKLELLDISIISLSDTVGVATAEGILSLFSEVIPVYPRIEFGAHLHSKPEDSVSKIEAVVASGCQRIDGAILGFGGCPMAKDDLVGNLATETIIDTISDQVNIDYLLFSQAQEAAKDLFNQYT